MRDHLSLETNGLYDFENFRLDLTEKVLLRDGKLIPLTPKVFETLQVFVENAGRLIEKDELMQKLWQDQFVEESNLSYNVKVLRKALGDNAQKPRFIETVPKRGFRFIAEVRQVEEKGKGKRKDEKEENAGSGLVPFPARQISASGAVVALADWRHKPDENKPDEIASEHSAAVKLELLPAAPIVKGKRNYYFFVLAGLICAIALTLIGFYKIANRAASTADVRKVPLSRLTSNGKTKLAAIAPNGEFVVYVFADEEGQSLWLKNIATGSDVQILTPTEGVPLNNLTFAPDGNYIYYTSKDTLYRLPLLGGLPKIVRQDLSLYNKYDPLSFSPDGKQFAFIRRSAEGETSSIVIANLDGSGEQEIASSTRPNFFANSAVWSPDGKIIACIALTDDGSHQVVFARIADGFVSSIPAPRLSAVSQVVWHPKGDSLIVIATRERNSIFQQILSISYPGGEMQDLTNDLNNYQSAGFAADGRTLIAVRREQIGHIWTLSTEDPSGARQVTKGIDRYDGIWGLNFLSNGKAYYETVPGGKGEIWTIDADGRNERRVWDEAGSMCVSPDGKYLVFQTDDGEGTGLFSLDVASGEKKRLTTGADTWQTFTPDGKWIVFTRWGEDVGLWKLSTDGGEAAKLTNVPGLALAPAISPDGKFIAFYWLTDDRSQPSKIAVLPIDGGDVAMTLSLPPVFFQGSRKNALQWTPDGQAINYVSIDKNVSNIWRQPLDGSPPVQVTNFESGLIFNFAYSPDGKQLALSRGSFNRDVVLITKVD